MEIGQIIEAQVYRVEPYGIFLRYLDENLFVHLPEMPDMELRPAHLRDLLHTSQSVRILKKHPDKDEWIASLRM